MPKETAGLMCPPLTWAVVHTMVATLKPKPREICTVEPPLAPHSFAGANADPQAPMTRNIVPINSANNAAQNLREMNSLQPQHLSTTPAIIPCLLSLGSLKQDDINSKSSHAVLMTK